MSPTNPTNHDVWIKAIMLWFHNESPAVIAEKLGGTPREWSDIALRYGWVRKTQGHVPVQMLTPEAIAKQRATAAMARSRETPTPRWSARV